MIGRGMQVLDVITEDKTAGLAWTFLVDLISANRGFIYFESVLLFSAKQ